MSDKTIYSKCGKFKLCLVTLQIEALGWIPVEEKHSIFSSGNRIIDQAITDSIGVDSVADFTTSMLFPPEWEGESIPYSSSTACQDNRTLDEIMQDEGGHVAALREKERIQQMHQMALNYQKGESGQVKSTEPKSQSNKDLGNE